MANEIKIDEHSLSLEMANQAANFLYVSEQAVKAEAICETTKYALDQLVAELDSAIRGKAVQDGKKVTEKQIEMEIELNLRHKEMRMKLIKARAEKDMVKAKRDAWYQRKDMLVQMAIKERHDIDAITGGTVSARMA